MIKFETWYDFRDAVEASIEEGKDTYVFAMLDTNPYIGDFELDVCNKSNEFYVNSSFFIEDFQKYLFIKYNAQNNCNDYVITLDWVWNDDKCYKRLFIFKNN